MFDREQNSEIIYDRHQVSLVTANYDVMAKSIQWQSPQNITPVKVEFDQFGRLTKWERGLLKKSYDFDMQGRLVEVKHSDSNGIMYKYDKKVLDMVICLAFFFINLSKVIFFISEFYWKLH